MSGTVTLTVSEADHQAVEERLALENLALRRELAVCVRTINELREQWHRHVAERQETPEALMDGRATP